MSWENILKNKVPTFEETGAFDDNKKEWSLELIYYTKMGYPAGEKFDKTLKFNGTQSEAIEWAKEQHQIWEDEWVEYGPSSEIMRGGGTWSLISESGTIINGD
jgi:hypothetical protein